MHDVLVLCYHAVSNDWPSGLAVKTSELAKQVQALLKRGYSATTLERALTTRSPRSFVVTFDDGLRSVLEHGLPVLEQFGVPATLFVPTRFVGGDLRADWPGVDEWLGTEHEDELRTLDWPGVRTLVDHGWDIGSHTCSHPRLTSLPDRELAEELTESKLECERQLGRPCSSIAYPYGDHDDRVVEFARSAGYRIGCTLPDRFTVPSALAWPRVGIYESDGTVAFRLKTSPGILHLRRTRAWDALSRAQRMSHRAKPGAHPRHDGAF